MATAPVFASTLKCGIAQISTANANRDGTGTVGTVFTAGSSGSRVECVHIVAQGTTTAGVVRLFIHDGSVFRLLKEVLVSAITPSTTVEVFNKTLDYSQNGYGLWLPTSYSLRASTHNAETFNVIAMYADV